MTVVPATVMSLAQTDQEVDGEGEVGDVVDEGVNGNEDDENENEDMVVNQSHATALHVRGGEAKSSSHISRKFCLILIGTSQPFSTNPC